MSWGSTSLNGQIVYAISGFKMTSLRQTLAGQLVVAKALFKEECQAVNRDRIILQVVNKDDPTDYFLFQDGSDGDIQPKIHFLELQAKPQAAPNRGAFSAADGPGAHSAAAAAGKAPSRRVGKGKGKGKPGDSAAPAGEKAKTAAGTPPITAHFNRVAKPSPPTGPPSAVAYQALATTAKACGVGAAVGGFSSDATAAEVFILSANVLV